MAAKIKAALGSEVKLIGGSGGIFDVHVDGILIYSKHATGSFPDETALVNEMVEKFK